MIIFIHQYNVVENKTKIRRTVTRLQHLTDTQMCDIRIQFALLFLYVHIVGCLHNPANVQHTCSQCNAGRLLEVCWTFAGSCKHPI